MGAVGFAISAILCFAIAMWMFNIGINPRAWRLWWLDVFGILDTDTPREQRHAQETHIRIMAYLILLLLLGLAISCAFWCLDEVREGLRPKTTVERELDYLKRQVDEMRGGRH